MAINTTNTTTKKATRPAGFSKAEWEQKTYRVYVGLLKLSDNQITAPVFLNHPTVKELMEKACGATTPEERWNLFNSLFITMDNYGTKDGIKVLKVKTITALRQWFNGGWKERMERPVSFKEPKAPKAPAKAKKATTTKKTITMKDVPEDVKKAILAEYYKANHKVA